MDLLIRDVPDSVICEIDRRAESQGVSRTQYLRNDFSRRFLNESFLTEFDLNSRIIETNTKLLKQNVELLKELLERK